MVRGGEVVRLSQLSAVDNDEVHAFDSKPPLRVRIVRRSYRSGVGTLFASVRCLRSCASRLNARWAGDWQSAPSESSQRIGTLVHGQFALKISTMRLPLKISLWTADGNAQLLNRVMSVEAAQRARCPTPGWGNSARQGLRRRASVVVGPVRLKVIVLSPMSLPAHVL
jgi:hypothetical protein